MQVSTNTRDLKKYLTGVAKDIYVMHLHASSLNQAGPYLCNILYSIIFDGGKFNKLLKITLCSMHGAVNIVNSNRNSQLLVKTISS